MEKTSRAGRLREGRVKPDTPPFFMPVAGGDGRSWEAFGQTCQMAFFISSVFAVGFKVQASGFVGYGLVCT